jgi:hypothetical protein
MKLMKRILGCQAHWRLWAPLCISVLSLVQASLPLEAQQVKPAAVKTQIAPTNILTVEKAEVRTWEDMQKDQAAHGSGPQSVVVPFRPTMSPVDYALAKSAAAAAFGQKPLLPGVGAALPVAPIVTGTDFDGQDRTGAMDGFPPDTHGAVGATQYVQVTNTRIDVYDLTGLPLAGTQLQPFFGYFAQAIFDPRVVYDSTWNRWVISAEAFPQSPTVQSQFLAISQSNDATGPFFLYGFNVLFDANFFWDFPQLGMDQDGVIVTANYFNAGGFFVDARTFAVAKARLYNGLGFSVPLFTGLCGTLAPPIVLDQSDAAHLICAPPSGTTITKYAMTDSSRPGDTQLVAAAISVPSYSVPPCAQQGTGNPCLDTSDARFVNASTQNGTSLWNAHTINIGGGFPAPKYYEFDTATNTVIQQGIFFASGTSFDWNVSITANPARDAFVTWSNTDPPTQAQVRFSGRCHGDPLGVIGAGTAVKTSPTFSSQFDGTRFRWGDYSAVTLQPSDFNTAWLVNEWTEMPAIWGSHITQIGFVPACP